MANENSDLAPSLDVRSVVRQVIEEFVKAEQNQAEPAYKAELLDERKRREALETRLNQVIEENRNTKALAEQTDRYSQIRGELQRLGVAKLDLAFKGVKDDIIRSDEGRLVARTGQEMRPMEEFLKNFVEDNPELLPARITGGTGARETSRHAISNSPASIDLEKIRPGMDKADLERARQEVARFATQALKGM